MESSRIPLPIAHRFHRPPADAGITPERIRVLVERFYERTRTDELLGPIFNTRVRDWDAHYEKMTCFWASATLRAGTYSGRPIEAHRFDEPGLLTPAHFERWVRAFSGVAREVFDEPDAAVFVGLAERMAVSISTRLGVRGVGRLLEEKAPR